jgi:hypothetical protein
MASKKLWNVLAVNGIKIFLCPMGNKLILLLTGKKPELQWETNRKQKSFVRKKGCRQILAAFFKI